MIFMSLLIFLGFLNARDIEAIRDHALAMIERGQQILRILNRGDPGGPPSREDRAQVPPGKWEEDPASPKQIETLERAKVDIWDGITKGEASKLIEDLFKRRSKR